MASPDDAISCLFQPYMHYDVIFVAAPHEEAIFGPSVLTIHLIFA